MMNSFRLYGRYAAINMKAILQYRGWPFQFLSSMLNAVWDFLGVIVLYLRFGTLGDWQVGHTLFAFGVGTTAFGLAEWFSRGLDAFPWYIKSGAFDRILLRPRPTILQAIAERFQPDRGGRVLVGIGCIIAASIDIGISWNMGRLTILVFSVVGGWFVYTGVFTIFATISFWTIGPIHLVYLFTNHTLQYLKIPFQYFGRTLRHVMTFLFPIATFTYFPVMYISQLSENGIAGLSALPAGVVFFLLSTMFWRFGVRRYHSTGT